MKKNLLLAAVILISGSLFLSSHKTMAGGGDYDLQLTPSATSAPADGVSAITFSYANVIYVCANGYYYATPGDCVTYGQSTYDHQSTIDPHADYAISVSGSGNTLSQATAPGNSGTFTLKSSVAETKSISLLKPNFPVGDPNAVAKSISVSFTVPAPKSSPTSPSSTKKTTVPTAAASQEAAAAQTPQAPAAPTISGVKIAALAADISKPFTLAADKPLSLSGKTVPNGVVTLTIHSTPKTVTTTADKDGIWNYSVTGLAPGNHYVEASVMDPATKLNSPTAKLVSFTIKPALAANTANTAAPQKASSGSMGIILIVVVLLALAAGGWYYWTKVKKQKQAQIPTPKIQGS